MAKSACAGGVMPAAPKRQVLIVRAHPRSCQCIPCRAGDAKRKAAIERERAIATFGEGRC